MELALLLLQHCVFVCVCMKFLHAVVVADDDDAVNVGLWMFGCCCYAVVVDTVRHNLKST
jgi:hypothetical protein